MGDAGCWRAGAPAVCVGGRAAAGRGGSDRPPRREQPVVSMAMSSGTAMRGVWVMKDLRPFGSRVRCFQGARTAALCHAERGG